MTPAVFERLLTLASELGLEGREGRPVGTLFVVGDSDRVLSQSHQLVINPFHGYPEAERNILDPRLEETIKEFSAIDGAFIIRGDGVILSAGRYLAPQSKLDEPLPQGLGTRHEAAAAITMTTVGDRALHLAIDGDDLHLQARPAHHRHPQAAQPGLGRAVRDRSPRTQGITYPISRRIVVSAISGRPMIAVWSSDSIRSKRVIPRRSSL